MSSRIVDVPLRTLSAENAKGLGKVFRSFDRAEIKLRQWPAQDSRPISPGTGYGGIIEGSFEVYWKGEVLKAKNNAVGRSYTLGWLKEPRLAREDITAPPDRPSILVSFFNYHPDGGQAFISRNQLPTVFLVAPPGDNVRPEDFVALYSDGTLGLSLFPGVWHQAPFPLSERDIYDNKQGSVHACVDLDFLIEEELLLSVPLRAV